jgi:alpha-glucosidase (family GH31 glycosyl hydrolase)
MSWPPLGEEPVVKTIIPDDKCTAKRAAQCWAREKEANVGVGVCMWWTDGSRSDDGRVGAEAVCKHGNEWRTHRSKLGTDCMEVFDTEL